MLRIGGPMRVGGTKGTMSECLRELEDCPLPQSFKLTQVRSLVRYIREVSALQKRIEDESGFEADTTSYLEILCAKEDSNLLRRVSDTRILKQVCAKQRWAVPCSLAVTATRACCRCTLSIEVFKRRKL